MSVARVRGFSLLELLACLTLMALLATVVTTNLRSLQARTAIAQASATLCAYDQLARSRAIGNQGMTLVFDLGRQEISIRPRHGEGSEVVSVPVSVEGIRIVKMYIGGTQEIHEGQAVVPMSICGVSPSYCSCMQNSQGETRWILISGISGQKVELANEAEAQQALRAGHDSR